MEGSLRDQISGAVCRALEPFSDVVAGWEGGSAAFGLIDNYSDIDLFFLVNDNASHEPLYAAVEDALRGVSPVVASHYVAPGRYYQLEAAGEYLLVDLCCYASVTQTITWTSSVTGMCVRSSTRAIGFVPGPVLGSKSRASEYSGAGS
jgi:hypothetical protein